MKKRLLIIFLSITVLGICSCGSKSGTKKESTVKNEESTDEVIEYNTIEVTSDDLHDGVWDSIITNTKHGNNVSPQLSWEAVEGAESYVIYMVDNTASCWMHWKSTDVSDTELPQGWANENEYIGPYPPDGTHEYEVFVIALKKPVSEIYGTFDSINVSFEENLYDLDVDDDGEKGNIIAIGSITGTYTAGE